MFPSRFNGLYNSRIFRLLRVAVIVLALPYIAAITCQFIKSYGLTGGGLIAAAETLNADTRDMTTWALSRIGIDIGIESERPMRYILVCVPKRLSTPGEQEGAENARRIIHAELKNTAGDAYVRMMQAIEGGYPQIVIDVRPLQYNGYNLRVSAYNSNMICDVDEGHEMKEWERMPASAIYSPETLKLSE